MTPVRPKVAAAAVGGALATILAYTVGFFGWDLPDEVVAALTTLLAFGAGWLRNDTDPGKHAETA